MGKRVAVVLSGCGYLDGAEVHEAVISLLALDRAGATYQCAAPDKAQMHVVDHLTGEPTGESRNVLHEAARIARGKVVPLAQVRAADFDAVFLPGGYGAAKNLSTVAIDGPNAKVDPDLARVLKEFRAAGKPIGAVCISPAVLVAALREGEVTIGQDPGTAAAIKQMGGTHCECPVEALHVDRDRKIVTAPAYMYGNARISAVAEGIEKAVRATLELA
ncbi:MAG: isoprenoid biosynthesis glyoxalase ElbB [Myxococcota bacterium]